MVGMSAVVHDAGDIRAVGVALDEGQHDFGAFVQGEVDAVFGTGIVFGQSDAAVPGAVLGNPVGLGGFDDVPEDLGQLSLIQGLLLQEPGGQPVQDCAVRRLRLICRSGYCP